MGVMRRSVTRERKDFGFKEEDGGDKEPVSMSS
jgi:hypothetical protein